jgi:hypothetical protein
LNNWLAKWFLSHDHLNFLLFSPLPAKSLATLARLFAF